MPRSVSLKRHHRPVFCRFLSVMTITRVWRGTDAGQRLGIPRMDTRTHLSAVADTASGLEDRLKGPERRRFRRTPVDRVGKVYVRRALRYLPVRALDVSLGGLLLEIKTDRPLLVGEPLEILIGDGRSVVVGEDDVVEARIAHVEAAEDGTQRVGLAFAHEGAMAAVAA